MVAVSYKHLDLKMKKQWAAVVLAGGAGRRLGGRDKTKLAYREQESFLEHILKELQDFSPIYLSGHPGPSPQRTWPIADKLSGMGQMCIRDSNSIGQ